jgi:hypothetical protein
LLRRTGHPALIILWIIAALCSVVLVSVFGGLFGFR